MPSNRLLYFVNCLYEQLRGAIMKLLWAVRSFLEVKKSQMALDKEEDVQIFY